MWTRAGLLLLCLGLPLLAADAARAQHGFVPPEDRPLHVRLSEARRVVFATVVRVEPGRVAFEDVAPVLGSAPPAFEIKRSPSRPPPWVPGDRALLLLSGARSPYRLVDKPVELVRIPDAAAEARWREASRAMDAARTDPAARRDLYARWCDGEAEDLAAACLRGLTDIQNLGAMDAPFALARARVAADPARPLPVRRRAAQVAARHPAGIEAMLGHLAATAPDTDAEIAEVAIQAGLVTRSPGVEQAIVQALTAPDGELGKVGMRLSAFAQGPAVERRLSELALGHPDAAVRSDAAQSLQRLRRNRDDG